jgi:hypothetical protein
MHIKNSVQVYSLHDQKLIQAEPMISMWLESSEML